MDEDEEFQLLLQQMNKVPKSDKLKSLKKSFIVNATKPVPPIPKKKTQNVKTEPANTPKDPLIAWKDKLRLVFIVGEPGSNCEALARDLAQKPGHYLITARKAITDLMLTEGLEKSIDLDDAGNVSMEPTLVFRAVKHSLRAVLDSHDVKLQGSTALCFLIEGFPCTLAQAQIFEAHNNPARFLIVRKFYYPV